MPGEPSKKDIWDKIDIVAKGILAIVVSAGLAYYTSVVQEDNRQAQFQIQRQDQNFRFDQQEKNRRAQFESQQEDRKAETLIRLVSSREASDSSLRSRMFDTLLKSFLNENETQSQIVALQMIGLNFRDTLQIKPMFEHIDRQLDEEFTKDCNNPENVALKRRLHSAARTIIKDQLLQIELSEEGYVCQISLDYGAQAKRIDSDCVLNLAFELVDPDPAHPPSCSDQVLPDTVRVQAFEKNFDKAKKYPDDESKHWVRQGRPFNVSYFDMPMVDYTRLGGARYSLVLLDINDRGAELALALLPPDDFSSRNAYLFDQLLSQYIVDDFGDTDEEEMLEEIEEEPVE